MQAVALFTFHEPGLELHHAKGVSGAALAGDDLEPVPLGVGLGELLRSQIPR